MNEQIVFDLAQNALMTAIYIVGPCLLTAIIVGVSISIFQAITSIQDMTLTFVPKIAFVGLVLVLLGSWMLEKLLTFTTNIFLNLSHFVS